MTTTTASWWRLSCAWCRSSVPRWYGREGEGPTHRCLGNMEAYDYEPTSARRSMTTHNARKGEACPKAKLTAEQVIEIRTRYRNDPEASLRVLAREYGVSHTSILNIICGKSWKHIVLVTQDGQDTPAEIISVTLSDGRTVPLSFVRMDVIDIRKPRWP